jgi:23S rRNA (guanine745-N1)-methyltransferase
MDFVCPKCRKELALCEGGVKRCPEGHSYDRARAGYYNLLLGSTGGTHGDNRQMVEARARFLSLGFYEPLAEKVAELVCQYLPLGEALLDAGCGEGYYTERVYRALSERDGESHVDMLAFDISKDAARLTARSCPPVKVCVASSYNMPLSDASLGAVMNIFSPLAPEETERVLASGGKFILAYPDRRHLFGLKERIYRTPYENEPESDSPPGFRLIRRERLGYDIHLDGRENIESLFLMTPYAYRTGERGRKILAELTELDTRVEFIVDVYEKSREIL